jgi:exodeoxyribonuclease VII small subunit
LKGIQQCFLKEREEDETMSVSGTTAEPTFEERLQRLQAIVAELESGALPLAQSVSLYKEGVALSAACRTQLEHARNEVRLLTDGEFKPFAVEEDAVTPEPEAPHG